MSDGPSVMCSRNSWRERSGESAVRRFMSRPRRHNAMASWFAKIRAALRAATRKWSAARCQSRAAWNRNASSDAIAELSSPWKAMSAFAVAALNAARGLGVSVA